MSTLPAIPDEDETVGLEDFDDSDAVMPTLSIAHKDGLFVDDLSGATYKELEVIPLGLVKGRILWPAEVSAEKVPPLCRSLNFDIGRPDPKRFPWTASGFAAADYADENPQLPCETCKLKEWGTNPKNESPWCAEQHQFIVLVPIGDKGGYGPAILTIQRTGLKPSRAYVTAFRNAKEPLFISTVKLSLDQMRKGSVDYSVPKFARGTPTDPAEYPSYAQMYRRIRGFLQTPRTADVAEEMEETPVAVGATAPAGASKPADDDLPF